MAPGLHPTGCLRGAGSGFHSAFLMCSIANRHSAFAPGLFTGANHLVSARSMSAAYSCGVVASGSFRLPGKAARLR